MQLKWLLRAALVSSVALLAGCNTTSQGTSSTAVTGSAGGATSAGASDTLERCSETLGTLAVDDGSDSQWYYEWRRKTQINSIEPMVRLVAQQSNCFIVTSLGNERLERRMGSITDKQRNSGEFRAGSKQQKGQRVAADYFLEPSVLFSSANTGGIGGAVGGLIAGSVGAAIGGGLNTKSTVVNLSLFGIREGVQLAASEGSSTATDIGAAFGALGGGGGGVLGGYQRTPEGKATVAAFVDAYNKMVIALKNYKAQSVRGGSGTGGTLKVN